MNVFRIFDPKGPKQDPAEKRRHQLRQAQRTYRDKTTKYTKSLEEELSQSRATVAKLLQECEQMRTTIQTLLESNHAEPEPFHIEGRREDWYLTPKESTQSPGSESGNYGRGTIATENFGQRSTRHDFRKNLELQRLQDQESQNIFQSVDTQLRDLDDITLGMEFILSLESPCKDHLHTPATPLSPHGHALTTSSRLSSMTSCPISTFITSPSPLSPSSPTKTCITTSSVPATILNHLLELSNSVCDTEETGELTPVQAWHQVREQPYFGGFRIGDLRGLMGRLKEGIRCHGYGAVLQGQTFQAMMYEHLVLGRAF